jgi:hypothetical protein
MVVKDDDFNRGQKASVAMRHMTQALWLYTEYLSGGLSTEHYRRAKEHLCQNFKPPNHSCKRVLSDNRLNNCEVQLECPHTPAVDIM